MLLDVLERTGRSERRLLDRVNHVHPDLRSVAEIIDDCLRHVAGRQHDVANFGFVKPLQRAREKRHVHYRHHRLGRAVGQRAQACAFASNQYDCLHCFALFALSVGFRLPGAIMVLASVLVGVGGDCCGVVSAVMVLAELSSLFRFALANTRSQRCVFSNATLLAQTSRSIRVCQEHYMIGTRYKHTMMTLMTSPTVLADLVLVTQLGPKRLGEARYA